EKSEVCNICGYQYSAVLGSTGNTGTSDEASARALGKDVVASEPTTGSEEDDDELPFNATPSGIKSINSPQLFVGREDDLARLDEEMKRVIQNRRLSFVTVYGPVGIGKSRLIEEFGLKAEAELKVTVMRGEAGGSSSMPFRGFKQAFASFFGINLAQTSANKAIEQIREKIGTFLSESKLLETSHLLAQFLGYDMEASPIIEPLLRNPSQMELRMFIGIRRLFTAIAEQKGLLFIIDTVDRAEPETVNLIHYLAAGMMHLPIMILTGGRDILFERYSQWSNGEYATFRMKLPPLQAEAAMHLFQQLLPKLEKIPKSLQGHIEESIDRNPRTIEELARFLMESGIIDHSKDAAWRVVLSRLATTDIPRTIEGILSSRIHLLPHGDRDILNRAATFGEVFWQDGVIALVRRALYADDLKRDPDGPSIDAMKRSGNYTVNMVQNSLERHIQRGFIEPMNQSMLSGEIQYRFKYPPIWNLVYDAIQAPERKLFHFQVAEWLTLHLYNATPELMEEVGRHYENAGITEKAVENYKSAAEQAKRAFHNDKAIRLFIQALSIQNPANTSRRILLWHDLGNVYEIKGMFERALSCYEKMLRLSWLNASRAKAGVAFNKMGRLYRNQGQLSLALEYLKRGLSLFEEASDKRGVAGSKDDIGQVLHTLGENDEAMNYCAEALEIRRSLGDSRSIAVALLNIGDIEMDRGLFNEAASCFFEALQISTGLGDDTIVCKATNSLGILAFHQGKLEEAITEWNKGLIISQNIGYYPMESKFQNNIGEALFRLGRYSEANSKLLRAIELAEEMHEKRVLFDAKRNLSLVLQKLGKPEEALQYAQESLNIARDLDIIEFKARASITIGEVLSSTVFNSDDPAQIEEAKIHFVQGVDLFRMLNLEREIALALKKYAEFLVEAGDDVTAVVQLREAKEIFGRLGMKELEGVKKLLSAIDSQEV
ncbi:tetratricopeptide repeat protein, partial [Myxococcota bacterium]|nr:tetratricopeptide repeat protein [Myxococcota bacterium]